MGPAPGRVEALIDQSPERLPPIGYRGERFDATLGQYSLRARLYDPRQGRFTSQDPFAGTYGDPLQAMRYGYAGANPVANSDPSGKFIAATIGGLGMLGAIALSANVRSADVSSKFGVGIGIAKFLRIALPLFPLPLAIAFELQVTYPSLKIVRQSGSIDKVYRRATPNDIRNALQKSIDTNDKIVQLVFASHGSPESMLFYTGERLIAGNDFEIAIYDDKGKVLDNMTQLFKNGTSENADIYLEGCNSASGDQNMARQMSMILRGRMIHSYTSSAIAYTYFDSIGITKNYKNGAVTE